MYNRPVLREEERRRSELVPEGRKRLCHMLEIKGTQAKQGVPKREWADNKNKFSKRSILFEIDVSDSCKTRKNK